MRFCASVTGISALEKSLEKLAEMLADEGRKAAAPDLHGEALSKEHTGTAGDYIRPGRAEKRLKRTGVMRSRPGSGARKWRSF